MKLLTTIAAVLISISAFSQDLIEYNESTYSLNGEKVSLEYKKAMTDFDPDAESMFELLSLGGTFSRNGEELSMEQIDDFTQRYNTGIGNFRRGYKFDEMHKNPYLRSTNNFINRFGGGVSGFFGGTGVFYGVLLAVISVEYDVDALGPGVLMAAGGAGLCVVSYNAFSRITSSSEGCRRKRDKQFNKVVDKLNKKVAYKLNQAIKAANQ